MRIALEDVKELARERGVDDDPVIRQRLAQLAIEVELLRLNSWRGLTQIMKRGVPGPEGSLPKWQWGEIHQTLTELAADILGEDAAEWDNPWTYRLLRSRAQLRSRAAPAADPQEHHRRARARPAEAEVSAHELKRPIFSKAALDHRSVSEAALSQLEIAIDGKIRMAAPASASEDHHQAWEALTEHATSAHRAQAVSELDAAFGAKHAKKLADGYRRPIVVHNIDGGLPHGRPAESVAVYDEPGVQVAVETGKSKKADYSPVRINRCIGHRLGRDRRNRLRQARFNRLRQAHVKDFGRRWAVLSAPTKSRAANRVGSWRGFVPHGSSYP